MKLKWGILGTAKIALEKVIPAMQASQLYQISAIASRSLENAEAAARQHGIPKAYGAYEDLIADPDVQIIYIPLPNHLHVPYALKCIEAGKHVLCEKPLALKAADIQRLIEARDRKGVKMGEAFMVRTHPQWIKARELVQSGALGKIRLVQGVFSYFNVNPENIRNIEAYGGGALWDIGVYPVNTARFVLEEKPLKLIALMAEDKAFGTDVLSSVMLQFPSCHVQFSVSTQMVPYQRMQFFGEKQELDIKIPFNAPADRPCHLSLNSGDLFREQVETIQVEPCNQYQQQAEAFTKAVMNNAQVPVSLEDSLTNTLVMEAIFKSAREKCWVSLD